MNTAIQKAVDVVKTPLPEGGRASVLKRFLRVFIPQIPAAIVAGIKTGDFWVGFGLTLLGAVGTALDKLLRSKSYELTRQKEASNG